MKTNAKEFLGTTTGLIGILLTLIPLLFMFIEWEFSSVKTRIIIVGIIFYGLAIYILKENKDAKQDS